MTSYSHEVRHCVVEWCRRWPYQTLYPSLGQCSERRSIGVHSRLHLRSCELLFAIMVGCKHRLQPIMKKREPGRRWVLPAQDVWTHADCVQTRTSSRRRGLTNWQWCKWTIGHRIGGSDRIRGSAINIYKYIYMFIQVCISRDNVMNHWRRPAQTFPSKKFYHQSKSCYQILISIEFL